MAVSKTPLLIIGAGITGLTLAQACRKQSIPFQIFERDSSATHRTAGWGLTLNWALPAFRSLLPDDILERLPETYVNKAAVDAGERGSFTFFDLSTGEAKWNVPASERIRVSRERLRNLMLSGLDVQWSQALVGVEKVDGGVKARFADGTQVEGCLIVGCDGANSTIRRVCHPDGFQNDQLPIRFVGTGVHYTKDQVADVLKLDPYFLQGSDPRTNVFLWFSFIDTPSDSRPFSQTHNATKTETDQKTYYCQIMTSWPYRSGFLGRSDPTDVPSSPSEQLVWMKTLSQNWTEPFRSIVHNIPDDNKEVMPIHLADWLPRRTTTINTDLAGRVVLLGDAAHTMVMYRGEGANHAIVDVSVLLEHITPLPHPVDGHDNEAWKSALEKYEVEMIERTELAVLASRQACSDAHDFTRLNDRSPLVRRRLMRADLEEVAGT